MTSLCTAFGALPFLFATGAGAEQRKPIGVVVFYGTLVSVFLTLFAVPAVYSLLGAQDAVAAVHEPARRSPHGRRRRAGPARPRCATLTATRPAARVS